MITMICVDFKPFYLIVYSEIFVSIYPLQAVPSVQFKQGNETTSKRRQKSEMGFVFTV